MGTFCFALLIKFSGMQTVVEAFCRNVSKTGSASGDAIRPEFGEDREKGLETVAWHRMQRNCGLSQK